MSFYLSPTIAASGAIITASGRAAKRTQTRITINTVILVSFTTGGSGQFSRQITVPTLADGVHYVILKQLRTDGVWAQTASAPLTVQNTITPPPPPPPPPPTTILSAVNIVSSPGSVSWSIVDQNNVPVKATGQVRYGSTTTYGSLSNPETSFNYDHHIQSNIAGLVSGNHFQVFGTDAVGNSYASSDQIVPNVVVPPPPTAPSAPINLVATSGDKLVNTSWSAPTSNGGSMVTSYKVYRNSILIASSATLNYTDISVVNGQTYSYQVSAVNLAGEGPKSNLVTVTPLAATRLYGMAIGGDTPANTQIGGNGGYNTRLSHRFLAGQSAPLASVRIYVIANGNTGYSAGTGGKIEVSVQPDNPTNHTPTGQVLAVATYQPGNPNPLPLPLITFSNPPMLTAGTLYHIVFRNIDASPSTNYLSINALYTWAPVTPRQPKYTDLDWSQLADEQGTGWVQRPGYSVIMGISYTNGIGEGMGYMGAWQQTQPAISGTQKVREIFTPKTTVIVNNVAVRLKRDYQTTGTGSLTITLGGPNGALAQATVPYSAFPLGQQVDAPQNVNSWALVGLSTPVMLAAGTQYNLTLSAPSGTVFRALPLQKGSGYSFPVESYFTDGYGQKSTDGVNWSGFDQSGGTSNRTDGELQFYFT